MLRTSLQAARALRSRPIYAAASAASAPTAAAASRPWRTVGVASKRYFADAKPQTSSSSPTTASSTASSRASSPASVSTPPKKKGGFFRKLRNYILTISILGALTFGGGVWYSRVNDNFHDFFTEYVPFGEHVVLYLEELDFQKRFPNIAQRVSANKPRDTGANVRVPAQNGASWRVAETSNRQSAAVAKPAAPAAPAAAAEAKPAEAPKPAPVVAKAERPKKAPKSKAAAEPAKEPESAKTTAVVAAAAAPAAVAAASSFKAPEVDEPSRWPPASPLDPLAVQDAKEPVVQDLVHMLNDIITVVNADNASEKYAGAIGKAKAEVNQVGRKIGGIRAAAEQAAAQQVAARTKSFDAAAHALLDRVEKAMAAQEAAWRTQVDAELGAVRRSYDERLALATARERTLSEEKLGNALLEQAVQMTQGFAAELQARVEAERSGRLGKLQALSAAVADLEALTAGWTDVVDASQRAQQLHVAIDAVRARVAAADEEGGGVTRPFVKELVAVKEIAAADPVVDAAIASIPPAAYQRGLASPAALIDRFRRVAAEVRKASLLPEDAGVASHASSYLLSKLLFKKQPAAAAAAGDGNGDVESILTRTQALLEEGNLDAAAREVNGLQGWAKTLSRDWLSEVRKVLEVQQALDVITAEARLRSLQLEKSQ